MVTMQEYWTAEVSVFNPTEGLHDEKGPYEEELDGALVCASTQLTVVLHV